MKSLKANPGAHRLIESLRSMGYNTSAAIADLVDNSITAGASEIHIDISPLQGSRSATVVIADNGRGMDRSQLHEAMRFGAFQEYAADDLGKYGLGLKTASLSQCRTLTVASKPKASRGSRPRRVIMRWDLDHVYKTDDWDLLIPEDSELRDWEREALGHKTAKDSGTVVLWSRLEESLPLLSSNEAREREKFLARLIDDVGHHLSMVFHRYMQGAVTGHRKLNLYVCGEKLIPWDPFCRNEDTKELDILPLPVTYRDAAGNEQAREVTISPFVLPREDEFSSRVEWQAASGPKNWNQQQGFYFYRNNRLLQAGGWSYLRSVDEHTKLLRVAVDFSGDLDREFSINVTKMRAKIPDEIRERIASSVSTWAKDARARYDSKSGGSKVSSGTKCIVPAGGMTAKQKVGGLPAVSIGPLTFVLNSKPNHHLRIEKGSGSGHAKILVPCNHDLAAIFSAKSGDMGEVRKICLAALGILEAVYEGRMKREQIPIAALKKALRRHL